VVIFGSWQVGQLLWSMLWLTMLFLWIWVVLTVFAEIFRNREMSGWEKALWTVVIVFKPWLGVLLYLIIHGRNAGDERLVGGYPSEGAWGDGPPTTYGPPVATYPQRAVAP